MKCVATIGSFDGVHRGHQCLLRQVRHIADERGLNAAAITFGTSPKRVLGMADAPQLSTIDERTTRLRQSGMDEVDMLDFTPQMAAMTARDFMQQILKTLLHVEVLVIGYDHRFGHGRTEGFAEYVCYGKEMGIEVIRGEVCMDDDKPISSTRIRHLLEEGRVSEAALLLGYRYKLHGEVVSGYQEGRKIGFPTANLRPSCPDKLIPANGVYAVRVTVNKNSYLGMLNIGYRPTMNNGKERSIEVHVLDFEGNLYGKDITVEFAFRLRDEHTFANLDELTEQLKKDKERVRELLEEQK